MVNCSDIEVEAGVGVGLCTLREASLRGGSHPQSPGAALRAASIQAGGSQEKPTFENKLYKINIVIGFGLAS